MPADATKTAIGAEIYILVCHDYHGDRGQGLTAYFLREREASKTLGQDGATISLP